jgi:uncharacterized protein YjbJ (UPF0337 family)
MQRDNVEQPQATGTAQPFMERIKQGFARLFGSHRDEAEGQADEVRGRASVDGGSVMEKAKGKIQEAGSVKREVVEHIGGETQKVEGRAKELEEKARQEIHR